jgi:hypothetical protein
MILQEHPFLHVPTCMLHPCQTSAIMQLMTSREDEGQEGDELSVLDVGNSTANTSSCPTCSSSPSGSSSHPSSTNRALRYLLAWLSVAGQPLGWRLPPEALQLITPGRLKQ